MKSSLALLSALLLAPLAAVYVAPRASGADAVQEAADVEAAAEWSREFWEAADPAKMPATFEVGETSSRELLAGWQAAPVKTTKNGEVTQRTFRWNDAASGLELHVDLTSYRRWPVIEWTGWLLNTGRGTSPVVKNLLAADLRFSGEGFTLHGIEGDDCSEKSYRPFV